MERLRDGCDSFFFVHLLASLRCDGHGWFEELAAQIGEESRGGGGVLHATPALRGPVEHRPHEAQAAALAGEPADDLDPAPRFLDEPYALVASSGKELWVANLASNSLTEISASTGSLVQVVSGLSYGFNGPIALAVGGGDLWVANESGKSLTEVNASTGSLIRVVSG